METFVSYRIEEAVAHAHDSVCAHVHMYWRGVVENEEMMKSAWGPRGELKRHALVFPPMSWTKSEPLWSQELSCRRSF